MKLLKLLLIGIGIAFGVLGGAILLRCIYLLFWLGDWDYCDFTHYASLGKDAKTGQVEFTEYSTGEAPWYSDIPAWCWGVVDPIFWTAC
jgi:hypothetical protein